MWKATIIQISEVDSSNNIEVYFDVSKNGVTKYENLFVSSHPDEVKSLIKERVRALKKSNDDKDNLVIGDEITL